MTVVRVPAFFNWTVTGTSSGTFASRPAAATAGSGHVYTATDRSIDYLSSGSDWYAVEITSAGGGSVSYATPSVVLGSSAAGGAASTVIRSDSTIAAFDATSPTTQAFGDSAAVGTAAFAARRDHKHAMPAAPSDASLTFTDITTNNASTSNHGFLKKLDNNSDHYMDGTGAWSTPAGTGAVTVGHPELVFKYTVTGADRGTIDTGVETPDAGTSDWANGDYLEIWMYLRTDEAATSSAFDVWVNNDTGTNYDWTLTQVQGTTGTNATISGNQARAQTSVQDSAAGANATANVFSVHKLEIPNYAGTTGWKVGKLYGDKIDPSAINTMLGRTWGFQYRSTSAISRIKIQPTTAGKKWKVGSQLLVWKRRNT